MMASLASSFVENTLGPVVEEPVEELVGF